MPRRTSSLSRRSRRDTPSRRSRRRSRSARPAARHAPRHTVARARRVGDSRCRPAKATCCRTRSSTGRSLRPRHCGPNSPGLAPHPLRSDRPTLNRRSLDSVQMRLARPNPPQARRAQAQNAHRLNRLRRDGLSSNPLRSDRPTLIQRSASIRSDATGSASNPFRCELGSASIRSDATGSAQSATGSTRTGSSQFPGRLGRRGCRPGVSASTPLPRLGRMPDLIRSEPLASGNGSRSSSTRQRSASSVPAATPVRDLIRYRRTVAASGTVALAPTHQEEAWRRSRSARRPSRPREPLPRGERLGSDQVRHPPEPLGEESTAETPGRHPQPPEPAGGMG